MLSRSGAEETLTSPNEQQANAPVVAMDAKLMVATGSGEVQQLKDLVKEQEQDSKMMVVVMANQQAAASTQKPHQGNMDPHLLALASSGSSKELKSLLCREDSQVFDNTAEERQACADGMEEVAVEGDSALVCSSSSEKPQNIFNEEENQACVDAVEGSLPMRRASDDIVEANESILEGVVAEAETALVCALSFEKLQNHGQACANGTDGNLHTLRACDDIEANELILEGVTAQGDTALHVVAASGQGDNFFTRFREAKHLLVEQNNKKKQRPTRTELHALTTYGDGDNFLESARIIYGKAKHLLFVQNNNGDTPLHCAARAGKSNMVACLIDLALAEDEDRIKELLRKENKHNETALHEAVRVENNDIVNLLMGKDSELAIFPQDGGASPMYLAIVLKRDSIVKTLYDMSSPGKLSFAGPNGQNALHAAVLRHQGQTQDFTELLEWNETHLCPQNKDLSTQRDENGSTPLHFASSTKLPFEFMGPSKVCQLLLEANPNALYQPDHAGFFPIHVAASVGAFKNVDMFVTKCPGSTGLRDAKGRTFLHVAVEKNEVDVVMSACSNLSLSWIMNMVDNDGNTALHLAVEAGSLHMFCSLLGNLQVNLNLPNNMGETPLDIAEYKIPKDGGQLILYNSQNSEPQIHNVLKIAGAVEGVRRQDELLGDNKAVRVKEARYVKSKETEELLKDSSGILCVGSVLIAAATFGATFAVPGGYIADDHSNGGSPVLARRYAFEGFIASNTLAFVFSMVATTALMFSGSPLFDPRSRGMHLYAASYFLSISITCLAAAFALGAYVVQAPVSHKAAVATCVITSLVLLYKRLEYTVRYFLLIIPPLRKRKGLICAWALSALVNFFNILHHDWPLIFIFGWAAHAN